MGYYQSNGELICLGRNDNQIKIHGLRIELEEIKNTILENKDITDCIVSKKEDSNNKQFLCAYYISSKNIEDSSIRLLLQKKLPNYMIPQYFIKLQQFPYTPNGKIDRKALPLPNFENNRIIVQSRNSFDYFLIESLGDLLNLNIANISIDDNFFELGGDSLSAINLSSKIYSKLNVEIFVKDIINNPKICDLSDLISTKVSISTNILKHIETQKYYPTSSAQQNIYIASNIAGENSLIYNIPGGVIFDKKLDIKRLEKCFNELIKRHESFRTYFELENDTIIQKIIDNIDFKIEILENTISEDNLDNEFKNFVKPFDLSCAPLLRAKLINLENNKSALLVDMHHIISDGTSLSIFINELCKLYNGEKLENIEFTYKDFAYWENEALNSQKFEEASKYWLDQFEGDIPVLNMPKTYSRPAVKSYEGSKVYTTINSETVNKINNICKEYSITPYMLLLSVYYILLSKYTSQDDIVVGSPIVGRNFSEIYNIIGMFVNTLPVRVKIDNSLSFKEFLNNIKSICLENYKYQDYPLNELISKLNIKRDTSRNPLFDTLFTYQNNGLTNINFDGINSEIYIPDTKISKFDFSLEIVPENDILNLNFEYCTKLFNKQFIENFARHYKNILEIVLDNLDIRLNSICILSEEEKNKILYEFNNTKLDYPKDKTIAQIFEEQVEKNPDNIAVVFENKKLTYKELNEKSNQLANYLLNKGIQKNKPIAVLLDRSINLIISMLAIIKCGGIYLPISTEYPSDRINYIIENSNTKFIITNNDNSLFINTSINAINLEKINLNNFKKQNINIDIKPNNGLYIIYTSGSTGNPKGVEVSHKNLNNFIHSFNTLFKTISSNDKLLASTYICFDVSIFEFFFSLLNGMSLYLYNENSITDIFNYCNYIINNNITTLYIPPNILNDVYEILRNNNYTNLHNLLLGVEPIKSAIIKKYYSLNPFMKIINAYGPTETTICSTATIASAEILNNYKIIPIGKPLNNLKLFILDNQFNPVPVGIPGELYISGDNVSNGYYLNKDLTDKNFISLPNITNKKLYKTGDIVMWNEDGNISFVGRNDSQIKFNGHRIELGEIGTAICDYPNIDKCIVLINNTKLIAYYTSSSKINTNDLQAFIKTKLPIYSIPNFLIQIKKFKLTSNGKIDKNYLKSLKITSSNEYEPPSTPIEKALIKMFENILNIKKIGVNDNFFELGGDSISAIKLQIESFNRGLNIPYKNIFDFPTVKQLANNITKSKNKLIEDKYDYSKIDSLLKNNLSTNTIKKENFKNILLTGSTGFLGAHILDYLLKNTKLNIYCIIRPQKDTDPQTRLLDVLHFYFGNQYDNLVFKRLFIIEGDITKKNLGMSSLVAEELGISLDCIINSAAIVKHYGNSNVFSETNISGTQNIIDFCNKFNCKLVHISTLSVSGNIFEDEKYTVSDVSKGTTFSEKNLFINQDLSNIYIYTKFIAERLILENILNNKLNAKIIRVGNLTNRYSDGKFQKNISENAFLNRFKSFIDIGILPDYLKEMYLEFTPVDSCAEAVCKLSLNKTDSIIYHLYNNNHITLPKLLEILNSININIEFVSKNIFDTKVNLLLKNNSNSYLSGIINDFDENKNLVYDNNINFKNKITNTLLKQLSFKWPKIDKKYIKNYIIYLRTIGYIK